MRLGAAFKGLDILYPYTDAGNVVILSHVHAKLLKFERTTTAVGCRVYVRTANFWVNRELNL